MDEENVRNIIEHLDSDNSTWDYNSLLSWLIDEQEQGDSDAETFTELGG